MKLLASRFPALNLAIGLLLALQAPTIFVLGSGTPPDLAATREITSYTEDLSLQRLGHDHVAARFVFRSTWVPQERHRCQDHEDWRGEEGKSAEPQGQRGKLCHFDAVFPRAVGVLLDRFKVRDLSLQMSKGRWDTTAWGNGPGDGSSGQYTPGGAEMWARLPSDGAWESWVSLRRSLSGLYCSSLDGMDETRVHTPALVAMPGEDAETMNSNGTTVLRGTLPREPVCTENLIPLIKMLPCRSKTGLGALLHPMRLFQSEYHSISVRATATYSEAPAGLTGANFAADGAITSVTLEQTVLAVFRPRPHLPSAVSKKKRGPSANGEEGRNTAEGWSIASLLLPSQTAKDGAASFDGVALEACPVATRSAIHVLGSVAGNGNWGAVSPVGSIASDEEFDARVGASDATVRSATDATSPRVVTRLLPTSTDADRSASAADTDFLLEELWGVEDDPTSTQREDTKGEVNEGAAAASSAAPTARLDHFLAGRGGTRGVSVAHLVNMHPTADAYAEYLQPVPFFMVPLFGTLRGRLVSSCPSFQNDGRLADPSISERNASGSWDGDFSGQACGGCGLDAEPPGPLLSLVQNITLTPGEGRKPAVIEARLWVPAASTLVLGFDFFKLFLTVDDFPPDPSRGFDVPPPLARFHFADLEPASEEGTAPSSCAARDVSSEECLRDGGQGRVVYAYGEAGLLDTPQPDFSMPFNVITFTSTVITFFLGTAINLLVRKSASARRGKNKKEEEEDGAPKGEGDGKRRWLGRLPTRVFGGAFGLGGLWQRWRRRGSEAPGSRIPNRRAVMKED